MVNDVLFNVRPAKRFKIMRTLLDMKQTTFADFLGIGWSTLRDWEKREPNLRDKQKERMRYVGINAQWIDYGTGEPLLIDRKLVIKNIMLFKQ